MKFLVSEKLDGISISIKYNKGVFIQALTRGDSNIGEDITNNVKKMQGVPNKINSLFTGHIRGEIILQHTDWKNYCSNMANPRNAASGIAKRIDGHQCQYLTVLAYDVEGCDFITEEDAFLFIKDLGFKTPNYSVGDINHVKSVYDLYQKKTRNSLDYDIDGLVVAINDRALRFSLGEENHRPKGAIAFKFEAPEARTIIRKIICQVGDTGRITPVAEFDSINLLGANITNASLHNFDEVSKLGIDIGAEVIVIRANDVIPYLKEVVDSTGTVFQAPNKCPECGSATISKGSYLFCSNKKSCPAQVIGRLNKWIKELGILEWGESILKKLIASGLVSDVADIYRLKVADIENLDRMGKKSAENLIEELDKFREVSLENFLGGLCIDGIATSSVKLAIDNGYDSLDKIKSTSEMQFAAIKGFGSVKAEAFYEGLRSNSDRINDIIDAGVKIRNRIVGKLTGKSFCFTGAASIPRAQLQNMVEDNGGTVKKSVGKDLQYLVCEDPQSNSSKLQAARKNGTKLISENDFLNMLK